MSESLHLLTGAYAVNALEADEQAEFEQHLRGCTDCQVELAGLLETAARLGLAESVTAPATLKSSVLAQIQSVRQLPPLPRLVETPAQPVGGQVLEFRARRTNRLLTVAAAFLGLVAATLGVLLVQDRAQRVDLAARTQSVARVLSAGDARTSSADIAGGGRAAVVLSRSQGSAVLLASDLAAPPSGRVYQMWIIGPGESVASAGTFMPDSGGITAQPLAGNPLPTDIIGLTLEPAGGSAKPTTNPLTLVKLA